ncbi:hypothetical protein [Streptomyces sp. CB03911]|uniref:hypothetical protein n=1 Tax=Streptomyces sp. CB03911 TaxID=1804758 RepID=UPI00093BC7CA|nr:hypothetical protein [Streptomyces sp. CB03911]OKI14171.1 hypothetical protein A6A07_13530 [Streptomyces sp. CB03911]
MSPTLVNAFVLHLEAHLFREWTAAMDAAEAAAWAPIRQHLAGIRETPTWAEQMERRRLPPRRPVTATPEWPPVAVPGQPGRWRHCINGQQVDLPTPDQDRQGAA